MVARKTFLNFFGFYAIVLMIEFGSSYFTQLSVTTWYTTLNKSPLTPPGMWFGIVWTILYFLMACAATRIYQRTGTLRTHALRWWLVQLLFGFVWCVVFFGNREILAGLQVIIANGLAVAMTIYLFYRIDRGAALMFVPLLLWLSFATYLNLFILQHN